MKRNKKIKFIKLGLGLLAMSTTSAVILGNGSRAFVECAAEEESDKTSFLCSMVIASGIDEFVRDQGGGVLGLAGVGDENSSISISPKQVGPSGRGGARKNDKGKLEVVDGAGRVTHQDLTPVDVKPFVNSMATVAVVGDAGDSPVKINTTSPVEGVSAGSSVFIGNAKKIEINVSGREGGGGRSAGVSAAMQILRGELGSSESIKALAASMGLSSDEITEPELSASDLAASAGRCEAVTGGGFLTPEVDGSGRLLAKTERARDVLVTRAACERSTAQEFSVQTVCSRPTEINASIRCEYPALVQYAPVWRRPKVAKMTEFTCADQVPDGRWQLKCVDEKYAVVGSAFRVDYVTLKPATSIQDGMKARLFHTMGASSNCNESPQLSLSLTSEPIKTLSSYDLLFADSNSSALISNLSACSGGNMSEIEKKRLSGSYVYKWNRNFMPGTSEERAETRSPQYQDYAGKDITKLTYWSDRGSETDLASRPTRVPYDDISTESERAAHFYLLDPDATNNVDEKNARREYIRGLNFLGFETPSIENAVVGYDKLNAVRTAISYDATATSLWEGAIESIICSLAKTENGEKKPGKEDKMPTAYGSYEEFYKNANPQASAKDICVNFLKDRYQFDSNLMSGRLRFREKLTYKFENLHSGIALRRPANALSGDNSGPSILRSVAKAKFEPRAIYIPGDLTLEPIRTVTYCSKITIDQNNPILLKNGENEGKTKGVEFIGPEVFGGASFSTYDVNQYVDFRLRNQSAESEENKAQTASIFPWANSFMKMNVVSEDTLKSGCNDVTVTHELTPHEKRLVERFKNMTGVLITAANDTITVYFSPIKVPFASKKLNLNLGLSPGLYLPKINVAPIQMISSDQFAASWNADGDGTPKRADMEGSKERGRDDPYLWQNGASKVDAELRSNFSLGIEYYALPRQVGSPSIKNDASHPYRSFKAEGTRKIDGGPATSEEAARAIAGTPLRDKPRYIKTLMSLDLGLSDPGSSATFIKKENTRSWGDAILTSRIGSSTSGGRAFCTRGNLTRPIKYPTKLISRRAEKLTNSSRVVSTTYVDANVVADEEVSDEFGTRNSPPDDNRLFFTKAYTPTSMIDYSGESRVIDEPINLAQDYNSFLAQIQTNTKINRRGSGTIQWTDPFEECQQDEQYNNSGEGGYFHVSEKCMKLRFQSVGRRSPYMPNFSKWFSYLGRPTVSSAELQCFIDNPINGSSPSYPYCFEFSLEYDDTFRRNRPPFMVHNAKRPVCMPGDSPDNSGTICFNVKEITDKNNKKTTVTKQYSPFIDYSATPLFRGVRPFDQRSRGGGDWRTINYACENTAKPFESTVWTQDGDRCKTNYNWGAGHFFPFARTSKWIFAGSKNFSLDGLASGNSYPDGYKPGTPAGREFSPDQIPKLMENITVLGVGGEIKNKGGFYLPAVGISIYPQFKRFVSAFNNNCSNVGKGGIFESNCTFGNCEDICESSDDIHRLEAAIHVFSSETGPTVNSFGVPTGLEGDYKDEADRTANDKAWGEFDLELIGIDGYIFQDCTDDISGDTQITSGHLWPLKSEGGPISYTSGYLPLGIAASDNGGLYYGPLLGSSMLPLIDVAKTANGNSTSNALLKNETSTREQQGLPVYEGGGLASKISDLKQEGGGATNTLFRNGQDGFHLVTFGRILADARNDLKITNAPRFSYEPEIALVPEVLAAFFLHSNVHFSTSDFKVQGTNFIIPISPYKKNQQAGVEGTGEDTIMYFETIGSFLSPVSKNETKNLKFVRNAFATTSSSSDQNDLREYARPMIFSFAASQPSKIKLAWRWDKNSVNATVKSTNLSTDQFGLDVTGGEKIKTVKGLSGVRTGVVVSYGAAGFFGELDDSYTFGSTSVRRSEGLSNPHFKGLKLSLNPIPTQETSGAELIGDYVDPAQSPGSGPSFEFSDNYCSKWRRKSIGSAFRFKVNPAQADEDKFISPFENICLSSALYSIKPADSDCYDKLGDLKNPPPTGKNCEVSSPSNQGNGTVVSDQDDCKDDSCKPFTGAEKNVYWTTIKLENDETIFVNQTPLDPPSCPADKIMKSRVFVSEATVDTAVFKAPSWAGAGGSAASPTCPNDKPIQIISIFQTLFEQPEYCYSESDGRSVQDTRPDKKSITCPSGGVAGVFTPTVIERSASDFVTEGSPTPGSPTTPTGIHAPWSILVGSREARRLTVEDISPSSVLSETGWKVETEVYQNPACKALPFDPQTGADPCLGSPGCSADGYPKLSPKSTFSDVQKRYGGLDPYIVRTAPKQVSLPSGGDAVSIAAAADSCSWNGGGLDSPEAPEDETPVLKPGQDPSETPPDGYQKMTQAVTYEWIGGAGANVTGRQFTPWSSERTDGDTVNPPSCSIFNDSANLAGEKAFKIEVDGEGLFDVGEDELKTSYRANSEASPDSSLQNSNGVFVTGGTWNAAGMEQKKLTKTNSLVPVVCEIKVSNADGEDSCDSNIPITYDTVEGFQIAVRAENGEHGGNAGKAIALTTQKPEELKILAGGGKGGDAGGTNLPGASRDRELVCYQKGKDPLSPWLKIYRFNKSVVTVAPASKGNDGKAPADNVINGWGVMPDAVDFLGKSLLERAKKESGQ